MAIKPQDPTILVCGEALMDVFVDAVGPRAYPARIVPGGSPFNLAVGLARLGVRSGLFTGMARDSFGGHLSEVLTGEGVDTRFLVPKSALTTLSVVATTTSGSPNYTFYGTEGADRRVSLEDVPKSLPDKTRAITFGSYTMAVEPVGDAYLALAAREGGQRFISLDPNIRPTVVPQMGLARQRFERFIPHATLIKASEEDIHLVYGATPAEDIAASWLKAGIAMVIVTRGERGATAFRGDDIIDIGGRKVKVRDTVGAGDTFHAATLAWLAGREALSRAALGTLGNGDIGAMLDHAVAASALTCTRQGADMPTKAEVTMVETEGFPA